MSELGAITVDHQGGDRFTLRVRGHEVTLDQPVHIGGTDRGPSPTELFVGSLAGCVAFYARRFLARHKLPTEGLAVTAEAVMSDQRPARVESIDVRIQVPEGVPDFRLPALMAVASSCPVHHTLQQPPHIEIKQRGA